MLSFHRALLHWFEFLPSIYQITLAILDCFACKPTPAPLQPRYRCWHHLAPPAGTCLLMKYCTEEEGNLGSVKCQSECQHTIAGWCSHPWLCFRRIWGMSLLFVLYFVANTCRVTFCLLPWHLSCAGFCSWSCFKQCWTPVGVISNYFINVLLTGRHAILKR